jgi:protein-tyrosine phosphatase
LIDFHSHILPNMDDGSRSVAESVAMLQEMAAQGAKQVVATPHFYPRKESVVRFLERREAAWAALREETAKYADLPEVRLGAEVFYYTGISDSPDLEKLALEDTKYILVEMPDGQWTPRMYRELEKIALLQGLTPIVAHVDRYIRPFRTKGIPETLAQLPVLVQANGAFFLDRWISSLAMKLLRKGQIHLLGSDAHNLESRSPNLGAAAETIRKKLGEEVLEMLAQNGREVLKK